MAINYTNVQQARIANDGLRTASRETRESHEVPVTVSVLRLAIELRPPQPRQCELDTVQGPKSGRHQPIRRAKHRARSLLKISFLIF